MKQEIAWTNLPFYKNLSYWNCQEIDGVHVLCARGMKKRKTKGKRHETQWTCNKTNSFLFEMYKRILQVILLHINCIFNKTLYYYFNRNKMDHNSQNNIKQKMLPACYFLIKRKKLSGQLNIIQMTISLYTALRMHLDIINDPSKMIRVRNLENFSIERLC